MLIKGRELFAPETGKTLDPAPDTTPVPAPAVPLQPPKASPPASTAPPSARDASPETLISGLNPAQQRALHCHDRPLLISAGPGTGKTRTITAKIAWLITEKKVPPESILALTFTNRAAREMTQRISRLVPAGGTPVCACTFHAFCLMVLKEYAAFSAGIADDTLRRTLLAEAVAEENTGNTPDTTLTPAMADTLISRAKQLGCHPHDPLPFIEDPATAEKTARVWTAYEKRLTASGMVDFEDLINQVLDLLTRDTTTAQAIHQRFRHLFVDEYQDVNQGQYRLTRLLADKGNTLCVIGDPDQSIYGFRGSDNRYFQQFLSDYPHAEKITLEQNYRSTETILEAAHQMLSQDDPSAPRTRLFSNLNGQKTVGILEAPSERAEAVAVGKTIERLTGGLSFLSMDAGKVAGGDRDAFSFSDFAVLYRTRKQGAIFAEVFEKAGIPCHLADRDTALKEPGIHQVLSLMKISHAKGSFMEFEALLDHLKAGTGKKSREVIRQWFHTVDRPLLPALALLKSAPPSRLRRDIRDKVCTAAAQVISACEAVADHPTEEALTYFSNLWGIDTLIRENKQRLNTLDRLYGDAAALPRPGDFLDQLSLTADPDTLPLSGEKVALMTMHGAKGLEFPVVFVTGCEDGLIPFSPPEKKGVAPLLQPHDVAEERRLFYVAMTRAMSILFFTHAARRQVYGKTINTSTSPFLRDIEERLKAYRKNRQRKKAVEKKKSRQMELF